MTYKLNYTNELKWNYDFLREKCKEVGIEEEFDEHQFRISVNYISVFQVLHLFFMILHCSLLLATCAQLDLIYIDVSCYTLSTVVAIAVMWTNVKVKSIATLKWLTYVTSGIVAMMIVFVDLMINYYHLHAHQWVLTPVYDIYVILMIYIFFPIPYLFPAMGLAVLVSSMYAGYFVFYLDTKYHYRLGNVTHFTQAIVVLSNYIGLNVIGTGFRLMREIVGRASFLDRHQYVMEDIALRSARAKERILLHSILPPQIAQPIQEEIRNRIKLSQKHHDILDCNRRGFIIAIQMHPDVSILYADIVNYTHLTTTLSVKKLVTLLHELYARFDNAAFRYSVQRIKFLGDCYYCVAGLTKPDPFHAKCCVNLGLCMIDIIREMRAVVKIDIDIRVGVHSGCVFAGVLGAAKLQYDIWGTDVLIANRLEATGMPGQIHVSERTLEMTNNRYQAYPGTKAARDDAYLQRCNIITFLIVDIENNNQFELDKRESLVSVSTTEEIREGTAELLLHEELQKMPLGPKGIKDAILEMFSANKHRESPSSINLEIETLLLHFRDPRLEYKYIHQPDYMLKFSVLQAWCCFMGLSYLQLVYDHDEVEMSYFINIPVMLALSLLLILTWYKRICIWWNSSTNQKPSNFSNAVIKIGENMQRSLIQRICIYMLIMAGYCCIISIILSDCNKEEFQLAHIDSMLYHYEVENLMCFSPWSVTYMVCLIITNSIIFTRIPFVLRIIVSVLVCITYLSVMIHHFEYLVHISLTTNPYLKPEIAHCLMILSTMFTVYFKERQAEFNNKINYKWREELLKKQEDARLADQSIIILLHNILPAHQTSI
ncbi:adenylyl cyclase X E-like isoform X2 [Drosophila hydei]|uniref:adenylate cyclase n=1 Tax=Drosophila hydei TaxID=7224 RepID=A0A6J1MFJ3_DROHY|nr:adenylyl cyclase X E-like isoform X2 [Drosophila hydei]